jgi:hypothetical protein
MRAYYVSLVSITACFDSGGAGGTDGARPPDVGGKGDGVALVELCPGTFVDVAGDAPASPALQACLDATPGGGELALPAGTYRVTGVVRVGRGITLRTAGVPGDAAACGVAGAPACATLRADANLLVERGFVVLEDADVTLDHLVIDGNRQARLASAAAHSCATGTNGPGFNARAAGCTHCALRMSMSINALCGTGFEWTGGDAFIGGNLVRDNGDHTTRNMWADGITITNTQNAQVVANYFLDNSDVDLILGSNRGGAVTQNTIVHGRQDSFAGLMLDNFDGTAPGDFVDASVTANTIECSGRCDYGIQLGPHPWYPSANIRGGTVAGNTVTGARMGIDADGAGTADAPITITGNDVGPTPASATFLCGTRPSARFNVAPDAVVDLAAGPPPDAAMTVHDCP